MGKTYSVDLDNEQLAAQGEHLERGGMFLPAGDDPPEVLSEVRVRLKAPAGQVEFDAQVVQVIPGGGIGLTVDPALVKNRLLPLIEKAKRGETSAPVVNIALRIQRMTTEEKREAAQFGDRSARMALMKDTNKAIHIYVLKNKKLTADEVRLMAAYRNVNPDALSQIARNRDWMRDSRVVMALVCNPKTPSGVAVRALDKLAITDLQRLAKQGDVPRRVSVSAKEKLRKLQR